MSAELPEKLSSWDFPDTEYVPNGYDMTEVPKMSDRNFRILVDRYNQLIDYISERDSVG